MTGQGLWKSSRKWITGSMLRRARHGVTWSCAPRSRFRDARSSAFAANYRARPPASARQATFALPPGYRLVQALIDDLPAPCVAQGLRTWQIAAPAILPYRLTIVCDTALRADDTAASSVRLESPQLIGMDVQKTL